MDASASRIIAAPTWFVLAAGLIRFIQVYAFIQVYDCVACRVTAESGMIDKDLERVSVSQSKDC